MGPEWRRWASPIRPRYLDHFSTGCRPRSSPRACLRAWTMRSVARGARDGRLGIDVSPVAVGLARELAERSGVGDRCRFDVADLDEGLPDGPSVDLIMCYLFRDPRLDPAIIERLAPGGLLAIAALSTVDVGPGPFRAGPGELRLAFAELDLIAESEGQGEAYLLARA